MNCYTYYKYQDALKNRAYIEVVGFTRGYNSAVLNSLDYMLKMVISMMINIKMLLMRYNHKVNTNKE